MTQRSPFRYFKTSPEIIRLAVMLYVQQPLSLRNVEDLLHERSTEISHKIVQVWWNRFISMFAAEIRLRRVDRMRSLPHWRWHLDEVYVKIYCLTLSCCRFRGHEDKIVTKELESGNDEAEVQPRVQDRGRKAGDGSGCNGGASRPWP